MEKEALILLRHFKDLSQTAWQKNFITYTDFLNLEELSLLQEHSREFPSSFRLFGGTEMAERKMAAFLPEEMEEEPDFPISCIQVSLPGTRFATRELSHRDYLGAILSLGIDRSKIGDIIVEEQEAYFFCNSKIASFLLGELRQIGRQVVSCQEIPCGEFSFQPKLEAVSGTVNSCRLDALIGVVFHTSRAVSQQLIENGRVFVNAKQQLHAHYNPDEGDVVSVRGYGKFRYEGVQGQSKKGRIVICLSRYR